MRRAGGHYIHLVSSSPDRLHPFELPPHDVLRYAGEQDTLAERVTTVRSLLTMLLTNGGRNPPHAPGERLSRAALLLRDR